MFPFAAQLDRKGAVDPYAEVFCRALGREWASPLDRRGRDWLFGACTAFVTWALYFAVAPITVGRTRSIIEMWTGATIINGLTGRLLAVLMLRGRTPPDALLGTWLAFRQAARGRAGAAVGRTAHSNMKPRMKRVMRRR
ncbi:hypothetical protein Mycsm_00281 [Mycobacterium sp. JS623]|nr:hypothetical protein Mycsm_00281 [Mycobacterium sp. JS623]